MNRQHFEFFIGLLMALGMLYLAYLSVCATRNGAYSPGDYEIQAVFSNCAGIRRGSSIQIAGIEIGRVKQIALRDYEADVTLTIKKGVVLQKDAIASIKTKGMIGEKYIEITPGAESQAIPAGGRLRDTEPAMDFEALISKYVQGTISKPEN